MSLSGMINIKFNKKSKTYKSLLHVMLTLHIKKGFLTLFKAVGKTILKIDLTVILIVPLSEKEMGAF